MKSLLSYAVLLLLSAPAYACSCNFDFLGDSEVTLRILTDRRDAQQAWKKAGSGKTAQLKYHVSLLEVTRGQFNSKFILTGFGGGDCGIGFRQGDVVTFQFDGAAFSKSKTLGFCNLAVKQNRKGG